jgi:hypothetical protein
MRTMLLHPLAGDWHATNHLWFMPGTPAFESHTALTITPAVQDAAMTLRYTWSHEGAPHEGVMLVRDVADSAPDIVWLDSFHTGHKFMVLGAGTRRASTLTATGSYAAPEGPDWGWRIELHVEPDGALLVRHYNILPDGQEALAIEARYSRG